MLAFEHRALLDKKQSHEELYMEFLRVPALSMGLYVLPTGGADPQKPHAEDEVYFVTAGKAVLNVNGEDHAVSAGSIVYIPARVSHQFHSIEEELAVLVLFAPAET